MTAERASAHLTKRLIREVRVQKCPRDFRVAGSRAGRSMCRPRSADGHRVDLQELSRIPGGGAKLAWFLPGALASVARLPRPRDFLPR